MAVWMDTGDPRTHNRLCVPAVQLHAWDASRRRSYKSGRQVLHRKRKPDACATCYLAVWAVAQEAFNSAGESLEQKLHGVNSPVNSTIPIFVRWWQLFCSNHV